MTSKTWLIHVNCCKLLNRAPLTCVMLLKFTIFITLEADDGVLRFADIWLKGQRNVQSYHNPS